MKRRDKATAKLFFLRVLRSCPAPRKILTDQLRNCQTAKANIPELAGVKHVFVNAAARVKNYRKYLAARFAAWHEFTDAAKIHQSLPEQVHSSLPCLAIG